jgi:hypothetical protein
MAGELGTGLGLLAIPLIGEFLVCVSHNICLHLIDYISILLT